MAKENNSFELIPLTPSPHSASWNKEVAHDARVMGRTIPSYRLALGQEYDEWKPFIKSLDKKDQKLFREMLLLPSFHISACMMAVKPFVIHPAFMSMLFQHYKQLNDISKRLGALEKREQAANN